VRLLLHKNAFLSTTIMAVLYRKYRSKSLDELVGQDHITTALRRSLESGSISHAYLFTGPKGTGKTSVARILAYQLNNLPYDESATHLDIIEIDAASNRRIDEIRDLRDKVHIAPSSAKYKVYIIDEVHMLTKEAFNALLKTLEEPPSHVIFILATTELHKVPETIISRTQRFSFKPIDKQKIVEHLAFIAKQEGIKVDEDALSLIADHSEGGFRDAISLLDQVRNTATDVSVNSVLESIGSPSAQKLQSLWVAISNNTSDAKNRLLELLDNGYHAPLIAKSLIKEAVNQHNTQLARQLLAVTASHDPRTELLLMVMEHDGTTLTATQPTTTPATIIEEVSVSQIEQKVVKPIIQKREETVRPKLTEKTAPSLATIIGFDKWDKILEKIKDTGHAVYGPLRLAQASVEGNTVRLGLSFPFHIKRVNEAKNLEVVIKTINEVTDGDYLVEVYRIEQGPTEEVQPVTKSPPHTTATASTDDDASLMNDPLSFVKNVFGDAKVL
jgi:DNA polymerase III subunit gamma/tau